MLYEVITNKVFSADLVTYLNVAGVVKGIGPGNRLVWASAYFSPDEWYTYIGTPTDRAGISVANFMQVNGYFMIGDNIPELPVITSYSIHYTKLYDDLP